jgi:hypothetical protein
MANYRNQSSVIQSLGFTPPTLTWTVVKGDTAAFRVYVTDNNKNPLTISQWTIEMDIKRPTVAGNLNDPSPSDVVTIYPSVTAEDGSGEFTVALSSGNSSLLQTGDIFDIQLNDATRVWTVARGTMAILEDVTDSES